MVNQSPLGDSLLPAQHAASTAQGRLPAHRGLRLRTDPEDVVVKDASVSVRCRAPGRGLRCWWPRRSLCTCTNTRSSRRLPVGKGPLWEPSEGTGEATGAQFGLRSGGSAAASGCRRQWSTVDVVTLPGRAAGSTPPLALLWVSPAELGRGSVLPLCTVVGIVYCLCN